MELDEVLGMELHGQQPRVIGTFDRLDHAIWRPSYGAKASPEPVDRLMMEAVHPEGRDAEYVSKLRVPVNFESMGQR